MSIKNLYTGTVSTISDTSQGYDTSQTYIGLSATTSFVPDVSTTANGLRMVADIKSGASFKNVVWNNLRVATSASGSYTYITPNSTQTNTIVVYDTDSTTYTYSGNNSTTTIWYNSAYK